MTIPVLWLQRFHAGATVVWMGLMVPSLLWLAQSVPWLVAMSVWANVAGHFASWMGARSEAAQTDTIPPESGVRRPRLDVGKRTYHRGYGTTGQARSPLRLGRASTQGRCCAGTSGEVRGCVSRVGQISTPGA